MRCATAFLPGRRIGALVLAAWVASGFAGMAAGAGATPMSAQAFASYVAGKTLYYEIGKTPYGAERYLSSHQVIWAFLGQPCRRGHWFPASNGRICFLYQGSGAAPDCWHFYREPGGLRAQFLGTVGKNALPTPGGGQAGGSGAIEVRDSPKPLQCPGNTAGV